MNTSDLARELGKHTGARSPSRYVRLRIGRARRNAEVVARWDLGAADADQTAADVYEAVSNASPARGDQAWAEVLETGGKSPVSTFAISIAEVIEEGDVPGAGGSNLADMLSAETPGALVAIAMQTIVQTNGQLGSMLSAERQRSQDIMIRHIETSGRAAAAETLLRWIEEHGIGGESDGMGEALAVLAPTLGPALASMVANINANMKAKTAAASGKAAPPPETEGERADRLLLELATIDADIWLEDGRRERVEMGILHLGQALEEARRAKARRAEKEAT